MSVCLFGGLIKVKALQNVYYSKFILLRSTTRVPIMCLNIVLRVHVELFRNIVIESNR